MTSGTCACGRVPDQVLCDTKVGEVIHAEEVPLDGGWVPRVFVVNTVEGCVVRALCFKCERSELRRSPVSIQQHQNDGNSRFGILVS